MHVWINKCMYGSLIWINRHTHSTTVPTFSMRQSDTTNPGGWVSNCRKWQTCVSKCMDSESIATLGAHSPAAKLSPCCRQCHLHLLRQLRELCSRPQPSSLCSSLGSVGRAAASAAASTRSKAVPMEKCPPFASASSGLPGGAGEREERVDQ